MGFLSDIGGLLLPGAPGTSTDPAKLFSGGGGGDGGSGGGYPAASFAPSQTWQLTAYQPNYQTFYNPLAMLQAGQPSFSDPTWYTSMLGPAQQQNMLANIGQEEPSPASPAVENPWIPGVGEYAQNWRGIGPVAGRMPQQRSQAQYALTGRHMTPQQMGMIYDQLG